MLRLFLCSCFLISFSLSGLTQNKSLNEGSAYLFSANYGFGFTGGDLNERFGNHFDVGLKLEYLLESDYYMGIDADFVFGSDVKDDPLSHLRTDKGDILGIDNLNASIFLRQRGLYVGAHFGKFFRLKSNARSGIDLSLGGGYMSHYIKFQDDSNSVPQVLGDFKKGYDHMTRGFALQEFIGYRHLSNNKRLNFYLGLEMTQGFTKNVRNINFDSGLPENESRLDLGFSIKFGWILPVYKYDTIDEEIFY